jgi:hypothetical protein
MKIPFIDNNKNNNNNNKKKNLIKFETSHAEGNNYLLKSVI